MNLNLRKKLNMLRQIIFLAIVGTISCQHFYAPDYVEAKNINIENNSIDVLGIKMECNTNDQISHQQTDLEQLKLVKSVEGILHYTLGARTGSK